MSGSWLAAQGRLPLAFMALALVWLIVAAVMLVSSPELLAAPHSAPAVIALTHAWVLGAFVTVATGAVYQLAPVALGTTLASERFGWFHFVCHLVGVAGMVYAFWHWDLVLLGEFGALVGVGIITFAANALATVVYSKKRDAVAWSLALATMWLVVTVLAGLTLTANRRWNFWPTDPLLLLRAHAHLGLIGFFVTMLQGVTFRLVPMFTLGDVPNWRPVRVGLWFTQIALVGLTPALAWHHGYLAAACGVLLLAGLVASAIAFKQTLSTRKKRVLDSGLRAFVSGLGGMFVAAAVGVVLVWPTFAGTSAPGGCSAMVYGILIIVGVLLPAIGGMMCKIVPFLTWMRAYGPKVGREPTPSAGALVKPQLENAALILIGVALVPLVAGAWTLNLPLLHAGAWLLAASVSLMAADMLCVFSHLWPRPKKAAGIRTKISTS
jgi:hypothetical protein